MMPDFESLVQEYYSFRKASKMKVCSQRSIDRFLHRSLREFPSEKELIQDMIDAWWLKRPTENSNSHAVRVCQVLPLLRYALERHPECTLQIPPTPKWKRSNYHPHEFTTEELSRFFNECDNMGHPSTMLECLLNELEFPVLFRLLLSTGMRTTEVRLLESANVNLSKGMIYVSRNATKGYRERKVMLHDSMTSVLRIYDKSVNALIPNRKTFFPNEKDGVHSDGWLSTHFKRLWAKAGNPRGVIAYDLRHHFIIESINSWKNTGYDLHARMVALSEYVGHSSFQMTYDYYDYVVQLGEKIEVTGADKLVDVIQPINLLQNEETE